MGLSSRLESIAELLQSEEFMTGLHAAAASAVTVLAFCLLAARRGARRPVSVAGLIVTAAASVAIGRLFGLSERVGAGLLALAAGGALTGRSMSLRLLGVAVAVAGAAALALSPEVTVATPRFAQPLLVIIAPLAGLLVADFDRRWHGSALGSVLFAISVGGVAFTVPDTEHAAILAGAVTVPTLLAWPLRWATLGRAGAFAATGILLWTVAVDGRGRPGSIVGGTACLGMLALEPVLARVYLEAGRSRLPMPSARRAQRSFAGSRFILTGHVVYVAVASRVIGLQVSAPVAGALVIATLGPAFAVAAAVVGSESFGANPAKADR